MSKPVEGTYPAFTTGYVNHVKEDNIMDAFKTQQPLIDEFFSSIPQEKAVFAYAPGKWTLKALLQHMIDTERVFAYRAMCIARNEKQNLPGFDENEFADNSFAENRSWPGLLTELKELRKCSMLLFENFSAEVLDRSGITDNSPVSVNSIGFIMIGHIYHHVAIIKERYL